jgi:hypothetical protein
MFRIPPFNEIENMSFDEAARIISNRAGGDLLEGMKSMDRLWSDYIASDDQDDDEFFDTWEYEVNAYNVVFEGMSKLFAVEA